MKTPRPGFMQTFSCTRLVNLLHSRLDGSVLVLLAGGSLSISLLLGLVNLEAESDEAVDALGEAVGLLEGEARSEQGSLEEEVHKVRDGLGRTFLVNLGLESLDDGRARRNFKGLLGSHVRGHGSIAESLRLHDTLHVGGPTELTSTDGGGSIDELVGDDDLLNLLAENLLDGLGKTLVGLDLLLTGLLLLLSLLELKVLGDVDKLLAIKFLELSHGVLVNGVDEEENLKVLGLEGIEERRLFDSLERLAGDEVNVLLVLGHASDVVGERGHLVAGLGGVEAKELGEGSTVLRILVDTKLEVLGEGRVELVKLFAVLGDLVEHLQGLLDNVLLDDLHDLVLLKGLTRQVEGEILRVDNTLDKAEPLGNEVGAVIGDEDTADVELDVVLGALALKEIEGSTLGNKEDGAELELTLDREVLDGEVILPVVGEGLVEGGVLLGSDVGRIPGPDGLGLVEFLLLGLGLLDLLGLGLLLLLLIFYLLNLGLLLVILLGLLSLFIGNLSLNLLGDMEVDGV